MRVRLVEPERRVCRLERGEAKRLPRVGGPLGFYIACPSGGELHGLAPGFECESPMCAKHVHVKDGEFVVTDVHA
jgi:hypothetical protein